ncbi:MAG: hypothetical protein GY861_26865 [bacterium]|nr:hypothetical protein [bacterium]
MGGKTIIFAVCVRTVRIRRNESYNIISSGDGNNGRSKDEEGVGMEGWHIYFEES